MRNVASDGATSLPAPRPDGRFGLVAGLYVAALFAPAIAGTAWSVLGLPAGGVYATMVGVGLPLVGVTTFATTHVDGVAVRLGATRWRWALAVVPGSVLLGLVVVDLPVLFRTAFDTTAGGTRLGPLGVEVTLPLSLQLAVVAFGGSLAFGSALGVMSQTRYATARLDGVTTESEWTARPSSTRRRRNVFLGVGLVAVGIAAFLVDVHGLRLHAIGQMLVTSGIVVAAMQTADQYRVSGVGLETSGPTNRTLVPWETVTGYSVTDEAVMIHRGNRLPSVSFDREDVDTDAVVAALDDHLDAQ